MKNEMVVMGNMSEIFEFLGGIVAFLFLSGLMALLIVVLGVAWFVAEVVYVYNANNGDGKIK